VRRIVREGGAGGTEAAEFPPSPPVSIVYERAVAQAFLDAG